MIPVSTEELTAVLQMSISPVALISGVGLLLLSMTNRLARTIDRARALSDEVRSASTEERGRLSVQIRILYHRSRVLRLSISLASVTILFASMIVFCLFAMYSFHARLYAVVVTFWGVGIGALIVSLVLFIHDITLTLGALRLNVGHHLSSVRGTRQGPAERDPGG